MSLLLPYRIVGAQLRLSITYESHLPAAPTYIGSYTHFHSVIVSSSKTSRLPTVRLSVPARTHTQWEKTRCEVYILLQCYLHTSICLL